MRRFRFSITNEDIRVVEQSLALRPGMTLVCMSSAGDTPLALLRFAPARVISVDASFSQHALATLKAAALRHMNHRTVHELLGITPGDAAQLYEQLRVHLPHDVREFFDDRRALFARSILFEGTMMRLFALLRRALRLAIGDEAFDSLARIETVADAQAWQQQLDSRGARMLVRLALSRWSLRLFYGVLPNGSAPRAWLQGARHSMLSPVRLPIASNPYLYPFLFGCYAPACLPAYLQAEHHDAIASQLDVLELVHGDLCDAIAGMPERSVDGFAFSNVADWLDARQLARLLAEARRAARPGARALLLSRNVLALPRELHSCADGARLLAAERSGYFRSLQVIELRPRA